MQLFDPILYILFLLFLILFLLRVSKNYIYYILTGKHGTPLYAPPYLPVRAAGVRLDVAPPFSLFRLRRGWDSIGALPESTPYLPPVSAGNCR